MPQGSSLWDGEAPPSTPASPGSILEAGGKALGKGRWWGISAPLWEVGGPGESPQTMAEPPALCPPSRVELAALGTLPHTLPGRAREPPPRGSQLEAGGSGSIPALSPSILWLQANQLHWGLPSCSGKGLAPCSGVDQGHGRIGTYSDTEGSARVHPHHLCGLS